MCLLKGSKTGEVNFPSEFKEPVGAVWDESAGAVITG